uniref:ACT domain-containing protein n=1 Tax=Kalanchoe fedtschenkoi TaxID=63787 RepID=A0A7N0T707_KALFE
MGYSKQKQKRAALHEKLQQLRSATNSTATDSAAIIDDASKYIEELIEKVEKLNLEISNTSGGSTASSSSNPDMFTMVAVETVEKGFKINVYSVKNHHGLLISILDAFDELGLDVLDATISCSESFHLEALGGKNEIKACENINEEVIRRALLHAMQTWNEEK